MRIKGMIMKDEVPWILNKCVHVVPEKIHTHPTEGHQRGVLKAKILEAKYEAKLDFPGGRGAKQKPSVGGGGGEVWILSGTAQSAQVHV